MRLPFVAALLLAATWAQAETAAPTIRSALEAADAATAEDIPVASAGLDEREVTLRELEFRTEKMRSARVQMQQVLDGMVADPNADPKLRDMVCKAAVPAMRAPDLFKLLRGKVKTLERPRNFAQLGPEQAARLTQVKTSIAELEVQPDVSCRKP